MLSILKKLDKRALLGFIILLAISMLTQVLFVNTSKNELKQLQGSLETQQKDTTELKSRLAQIQRDGTQGIDVLVSRLSTMEKALPNKIDDITLSSHFSQIATSSGVTLEQFDKSTTDKGSTQDILMSQSYNFSVTGDVGSVLGFINQVQQWNQDVITFYAVTMNAKGASNNPTLTTSVYNGNVTLNGKVNIWFSSKPSIVINALNAAATTEATTNSSPTPAPSNK